MERQPMEEGGRGTDLTSAAPDRARVAQQPEEELEGEGHGLLVWAAVMDHDHAHANGRQEGLWRCLRNAGKL
jgi:hypothetical protein